MKGAWLCAFAIVGCGASTRAVYEGDVRFEHCMSLDTQTTIKPSIRRQCWIEWVAFYTYGQTRDRVGHAQVRIEQLSDVGDFVLYDPGSEGSGQSSAPLAAPGPTDATAPPPMMSAPAPGAGSDTRELCAQECRSLEEECSNTCAGAPCRRACSNDFRVCIRRCS